MTSNEHENVATRLWYEGYGTTSEKISSTTKICKSLTITFSKTELTLIQSFLKKNKISSQAFLHAAWGLLLNRLSTSDSVIFGSGQPVKSRSKKTTAQTMLIAVKCVLNEKITTLKYIDKIAGQLNSSKNKPTEPSDEIRYLLLNGKKEAANSLLSDRFPLLLNTENDTFSKCSLIFNTHFFTKENIERIEQHFKLLATEMCENPNKPVATLCLIAKKEREQILKKWSKPKYDFTVPALTGCIHELIEEQATMHPGNLAINYNEQNVTYKELNLSAHKLARILLNKGIKPGDPVCVLMDRTPLLIITMLAVFKCGAIYVPINPKYPDERITYLIEDSQATHILANDLTRIPKEHQDKTLVVDTSFKEMPPVNDVPMPHINSDHIAYIIYTSGTTGKPKGVMIKHKSVINLVAWYRACFKVTQEDCASQFASQAFDTFLCEVIPFLASGASVHIVDDNIKLTPDLFFHWLQSQKITICDLPTSYAQLLFSMKWPTNLALKMVKIGGESVTRYPGQVLLFDLWDGYGPTESTIEFSFKKMRAAKDEPSPAEKDTAPPIGKPIANCEAYIVDKYLQPVPTGVCGELLIGGVGLAAGYLNYPELTNEKFIPHLFSHDKEAKLYRTGDLVRWLENGEIEFVGRIDFQVKIRGYRIEIGDIENSISKLPDVNEVVVLAKENSAQEKMLIAYVVPNLDKERFLYQERCKVSQDDFYQEAITFDISKDGIGIAHLERPLQLSKPVKILIKLPGLIEPRELSACVIWQQNDRCGLLFTESDEAQQVISKSIDYYLSEHNVMEMVLTAAAKRSLRRALQKKLPEYMVPSAFVNMMQFPLTFSGKIDVKALTPPENIEQLQPKKMIAPKTDTEKKLAEIWCQILKKSTVSMADNFFELGGSSISSAELSVQILQAFNTTIPANILFDLPYIPVLAQYIDSHGLAYNTNTSIQDEIKRDCMLFESITPTLKLSPRIKKPEHILLTGAGGFLGIYLLRELLRTTDAKIYCLIRKNEFDTAAKRLMATVDSYHLAGDISLSDRRIVAIASDLSFDNFGLPRDQYESLAKKVDLVYHCGAQVNVMASYQKMRGSNVLGTREVIKFATRYVDKPIHFISTLSSAYLKDEAGLLTEEFPTESYQDLYGGYAISKWVSERMLTELKNRGLPVSIYRSGYIAGQSDKGTTNLNDALLLLIKGCIQLGYAPDWNEKITILPVDEVSRAIIGISLAHPAESHVYHVDHPTGIMWPDLVAWVNQYGYKIKIIPMKEWQKMLVSLPSTNALFPFLPYYITLPNNSGSSEVSTARTMQTLRELSIKYPEINDTLLRTYFQFMRDSSFIPDPEYMKPQETT